MIKNFLSSASIVAMSAPDVVGNEAGQEVPAYSPELFKEYDMAYYRKRFPEETKGMSDEHLFTVAIQPDDDLNDDEWKALFRKHNPVMNIDGEALADHAKKLASQGSKGMTEAVETVMKAKEDWQGGSFKVMFALQAAYSPEQLAEFAVPDSETGNNPDYFKVPRVDARTNKTRMVDTSFYVQFADGTNAGQALLAAIEQCERAGDPKAMKDDIPAFILEKNPQQRETYLNFLIGRRNTIRQAYKKAMALYFQFQRVSEYPGIAVDCIYAEGKSPADVEAGKCEVPEVENTTKPIQVWLKPEEGKPIAKWEALSIGAFLKLNPKKGEEKGGTFQALIESGVVKKKVAGAGATSNADKSEGALVIKTIETGVSILAEFHRWMEEIHTAKDKAEVGRLYKLANAKDNDEFVVAIIETRNMLADLAKNTGLDAKYVKLQQAGSDMVMRTETTAKAS